MSDRLVLPGQRKPTMIEQQAAAVHAELMLGRVALRVLVATMADKRQKKISVSEKKIAKAVEAGYRLAIRQRDGKTTVELVSRDEPDPTLDGESEGER